MEAQRKTECRKENSYCTANEVRGRVTEQRYTAKNGWMGSSNISPLLPNVIPSS